MCRVELGYNETVCDNLEADEWEEAASTVQKTATKVRSLYFKSPASKVVQRRKLQMTRYYFPSPDPCQGRPGDAIPRHPLRHIRRGTLRQVRLYYSREDSVHTTPVKGIQSVTKRGAKNPNLVPSTYFPLIVIFFFFDFFSNSRFGRRYLICLPMFGLVVSQLVNLIHWTWIWQVHLRRSSSTFGLGKGEGG